MLSLRRHLVVPCGMLTTAVALMGVWFVSWKWASDPMGFHYFYVLPVGAIVVGLCAGSGYFISGHYAGLRVNRPIIWVVVLLQVFAYFAAQYIEFRSRGPLVNLRTFQPVGFWEYFHLNTTALAWARASGGSGETLGYFGYFIRLVEIAGFAGATGLLMKLLSSDLPYCEVCHRYRETRHLIAIPASVAYPTTVNEETLAQFEAANREMMEQAEHRLEELDQLAADGDSAGFLQEMENSRRESRKAGKLPIRIVLEMSFCRGCFDGVLQQHVHTMELTGGIEALPTIKLDREFVGAIAGRKITSDTETKPA